MMTHMRPRLSVSLACLTAVLALSACGTPGSSGDSVSQPSGAVSTGFDTSKHVTLTMWDTENATGPSKAEDELIQQFEQKYPNVTVKRVELLDQLRSEEHTSELQSHVNLVCRLLLEKNKHVTRAQQNP